MSAGKLLDLRNDVRIGDTVKALEAGGDRELDGMIVARGDLVAGAFFSSPAGGGDFALVRGLGVVDLARCISWAPAPAPTGRTSVMTSKLGGWRVDVYDGASDKFLGSEVLVNRPKAGDLDALVRKFLGARARRVK